LEESPWKDFELNPSKLGRRLREYSITTGKDTTGNERGYRLEHFIDAFERYLPSEAVRSRQNGSEQHEQSGTFDPSGTFEASGENKASEQNGRSEAGSRLLTASDTISAGNCPECGYGGVPDGYTMHHDCARKASASPALQRTVDCRWCGSEGMTPSCPDCGRTAA
jgi:hypothetical protein